MKNYKFYFFVFLLTSFLKIGAQANFTVSPSFCVNGLGSLTAMAGTMSPSSYTWTSSSSMVLVASQNSSTTLLAFYSAGTFTITLGITSGTQVSSMSHTLLVNSQPTINPVSTSYSVCSGYSATITAFGALTYTWAGTTLSTSIVSNSIQAGVGNYTVSGTDNNGCAGTATTNVQLAQPLTMNVSPATATTCIASNLPKFSKPVHLTASGAGNYTWFPYTPPQVNIGAQIDVRPVASTCYTVIGTTAVCSGTTTVCVTVVPQFSVHVMPPFPMICTNESITLAVEPVGAPIPSGPLSAFTYVWAEPIAAPPISLSSYFSQTVSAYPQSTSTYTVEIFDAINCASFPQLVTVSVTACTGIKNEIAKENSFKVYPNPATDKLLINSEKTGPVQIQLTDSYGRILLTKEVKLDGAAYSFDLKDFAAGIYFIKMNSTFENPQLFRIIKE